MPGFEINQYQNVANSGNFILNVGGGRARPDSEYYYSYTWSIDDIFGDSDSLLINARDMTLPAFTADKETVLGGSVDYKFAKSVSFDDVKITWYDTVGLIDVMKKWRQSVWTQETGLSPAGRYKKVSHQRQYIANIAPDGGDNKSRDIRYTLHGSWPSTIRHGDLTYTSSDVKLIEVTITYDWADEETY